MRPHLQFLSVSFGAEDFNTPASLLLVQSCGRYLFNLAKDFRALIIPRARVSKIATPVSATEAHTVFCTPNTDDRIGGVARLPRR